MKVSQRLRGIAQWLHLRGQSRRQVPTDLADKIRERLGPRVVEGPAGLHSTLFDVVIGEEDPSAEN